jgi:hypothetical protein
MTAPIAVPPRPIPAAPAYSNAASLNRDNFEFIQMINSDAQPHFDLDLATFNRCYDREPFGYAHRLNTLDLFSENYILRLLEKYTGQTKDYFVSAGARTPGTEFFSVPNGGKTPAEAMARLEENSYRILLKRLENHDADFRDLLNLLFQRVVNLQGGLNGARIERLESALFISSGATITPFHFDPEINFFAQIEGEKRYHVYSPAAVTDSELEKFYVRGKVEIGQIDLAKRDPAYARLFVLKPGLGLHQPQNAPHWVETGASRSISYSFVFETSATRTAGRARGYNHYVRKLGLQPSEPGARPVVDTIKSQAMLALTPLRSTVGAVLHRVRN